MLTGFEILVYENRHNVLLDTNAHFIDLYDRVQVDRVIFRINIQAFHVRRKRKEIRLK